MRLVTSGERKTPTDWSRDGRFILFHSRDPQRSTDLWVLPVTKERVPYVLLRSPFRKANAVFSPDGRWVAYHSDESGRPEIYVRSFVAPDSVDVAAGQWQVSTAGGIHPAWRADGRELYYVDPAGAMMAAPITIAGTEVQAGAPVRLFSTRILGGGVDEQQGRQYDVAPDGRFLINTVLDSAAAPITLIQNWSPDAKK
jgi:eukaryotic-like serine/threonine-protein kinase